MRGVASFSFGSPNSRSTARIAGEGRDGMKNMGSIGVEGREMKLSGGDEGGKGSVGLDGTEFALGAKLFEWGAPTMVGGDDSDVDCLRRG